MKLVISDSHEGPKGAVRQVIGAIWQRCWVHFMSNALAHVPRGQHSGLSIAIRQAVIQPDRKSAGDIWRQVADQLRPRWPKLRTLMDEAGHDVLLHLAFPAQYRTKLHSTNRLERLNKEVRRRADVVRIIRNEERIIRSIGAAPIESDDEGQLQHHYMQVEGRGELDAPAAGAQPMITDTEVAWRCPPQRHRKFVPH